MVQEGLHVGQVGFDSGPPQRRRRRRVATVRLRDFQADLLQLDLPFIDPFLDSVRPLLVSRFGQPVSQPLARQLSL